MGEREQGEFEEVDLEQGDIRGTGSAGFSCEACGYAWRETVGEEPVGDPACPMCGSRDVTPS